MKNKLIVKVFISAINVLLVILVFAYSIAFRDNDFFNFTIWGFLGISVGYNLSEVALIKRGIKKNKSIENVSDLREGYYWIWRVGCNDPLIGYVFINDFETYLFWTVERMMFRPIDLKEIGRIGERIEWK